MVRTALDGVNFSTGFKVQCSTYKVQGKYRAESWRFGIVAARTEINLGRVMNRFLMMVTMFAAADAYAADEKFSFSAVKSPAYSVSSHQDELIIAVSPAGQSLRIAGSYGTVLGVGIDAISNSKYRRAIADTIADYDAKAVFIERLNKRLAEVFEGGIDETAPLGSTAGYANPTDAVKARYAALGGKGRDVVLDLDISYGIFGYEGLLVARIDAEAHAVPGGKRVWSEGIAVSGEPILGPRKLQDMSKSLMPSYGSPRFSAEDDAIAQWTGDGGVTYRKRFEEAVDGAASALVCSLGLAKEAAGEYYLGKVAMNRKDFAEAEHHFQEALAVEPGMLAARNGLAVTLAHDDRADEAEKAAREIVKDHPDFGEGWMNLAWIQVMKLGKVDEGRKAYDKARELGLGEEKALEKKLKK